MKKAILLLALGVGITFGALAQTGEDQASKSRGNANTDANIKSMSALNSPGQKAIAPEGKGDGKSRGSSCSVNFENYTPWKIQCYIDGYYYGLVHGYGSGSASITPGSASLYAVADFDDGSRLTWGPRSITCSGSYTWNLKP